MERPDFIVGVDLGQSNDYTAIAVVERTPVAPHSYAVRHLERTRGKPYPDIISEVAALATRRELAEKCSVIVDKTGVGTPIFDALRKMEMGVPLYALTITGGSTVTPDPDGWRVPKRDIVSALVVLLESGRLQFAKKLALADTFVLELQNFRVKITAAGNDTYEALTEGTHDDLVLAVGLACWAGEFGHLEVLGQPSIEEEIRAKMPPSNDPNVLAMQDRIVAQKVGAASGSVRIVGRRGTSRHRESNPWDDFYEQ
jgi:hypothetical protein